MRQAIDLVDERVPIRIDSEAFRLDQKGDAQSHTFRPSSGDVELNVWVYDCYTTSGTDQMGPMWVRLSLLDNPTGEERLSYSS